MKLDMKTLAGFDHLDGHDQRGMRRNPSLVHGFPMPSSNSFCRSQECAAKLWLVLLQMHNPPSSYIQASSGLSTDKAGDLRHRQVPRLNSQGRDGARQYLGHSFDRFITASLWVSHVVQDPSLLPVVDMFVQVYRSAINNESRSFVYGPVYVTRVCLYLEGRSNFWNSHDVDRGRSFKMNFTFSHIKSRGFSAVAGEGSSLHTQSNPRIKRLDFRTPECQSYLLPPRH